MKKIVKLLGIGALSLASILGVASCSKTETKTYKNGELKVSVLTGNIRVSIDILAEKLGYFEEEGLNFTPVNIGGNDALTAIEQNSNSLDVLTTGFVADLQHIGQGADLTFIGGTAVEGGAIITYKGNSEKYKDSNTVINIEEFENAKFGLARNEAAWVVTRQYLKENDPSFDDDIDSDSSSLVNYYADQQSTALAVSRHEVEIGYLPLEYAYLYQDSYGLEIIAEAGELQSEYVCCREVTSKQKYEDKYDSFVAYEKARIRAWEYYSIESNQESVVNIVANYSGKEADYVRTYLYGGVTKFSTDPNKKGINAYKTAALNAGIIKSDIDLSSNISTGAYKEAIETLANNNKTNTFYQEKLALFNAYN